ncbi:hypothetical protein MAPG_10039 [Magnaporthiopsis poae ATCC 64411]|uniref:Uncharacterized protein n=1 Tax=Magnaporthiopsis poae (strain ATCC 64411 / 73-15) TaxID=644358 RepID=A0A0C4EBJ0_MAGP6|nr:hypothetical protein MAPG_10039 [Magnaporthiopsis poae ATCC 64411]
MFPRLVLLLTAVLLAAPPAAAEPMQGAVMMHEMAPASTTLVLTQGIQTTVVMPLPTDEEPGATAPPTETSAIAVPRPVSTAGAEHGPRDGGSILGVAVACGLGLLAM